MNEKEFNDAIIEEVPAGRQAYAEKFDYDLKAIGEDLKRRQEEGGRVVVTLKPKPLREIRKAAA